MSTEERGSGADLAREILARAKQDARARGGRRAASWSALSDGQPSDRAAATGGDGTRADPDRQAPRRPRQPGMAVPGREWRSPMGFGSAIARLVADRGWQARVTDASVLARWDVLVGPDIAAHCTPVSLRDGELELVAESTAWATQLRMLSRQILGMLQRELGPNVVHRITVRGPSSPSRRRG